MINIPKSQVPNEYEFVKALDVHKAVLKEWQDHMRRVDSDAINVKIKPIDKHTPYQRPIAPALIEQVMQNGGTYTLVDDGPTPEQQLEEQKQQFFNDLNTSVMAATNKVVSPIKQTLYDHREMTIIAGETKRTLLAKVTALLTSRSPEDAQFLTDQQTRRQRLNDIRLKAMQARSDIEDLTTATVKSWKNPEL